MGGPLPHPWHCREPDRLNTFIGIDLGTSGCRAVAIDEAGNIKALASAPLPPPERSQAGHNQQDPEHWWQVVTELLRQIGEACEGCHFAAIAVDGTSSTLLLSDPQGEPITPALMYNDSRSRKMLTKLKQVAPEDSPVLSAGSSLAKLLYLRQQVSAKRYFALHQADWIAGKLCGRFPLSDENNALKLGYDPIRREWPAWIAGLDIARETLPRVSPCAAPIGRLSRQAAADTGLKSGIPIVAGTTDGNAAFLAAGAAEIGEAVTSLGSTLVLKILSGKPVFAAEYGIYSHRLGERWLVGGASNSGGAVLRDYFDEARMQSLTSLLKPDRPTRLDYYPLSRPGERFPINDADYPPRLHPRPTSDAIFFQALLEGIARIESEGYLLLQRLGAPKPSRVLSIGGGALNEPWRMIREQALGIPVVRAAQQEAAYGTALLAMQGAEAPLGTIASLFKPHAGAAGPHPT
ncbi:MAG: FGGY-family carbohydrate kinase [Candidatus Thiodiazotropha sp. (ex Epidulcina cf. delphinae)]|nr:FGGY-family carbohydrate kinase [Candidatus Thiodiazotropha sp. (ex Epidulcina cf. delphinae)]